MFRNYFCLVLLVLVAAVNCERKTYHLVKVEGEKRIPQDIVHDQEANTVTISVGDVSKYSDKFPTVNYHDFDTGYVVFKDIRRKLCLLSLSPIPFATPFIYSLGETKMSLDYEARISHDLLHQEKVTDISGQRIADFCSDYNTYMMDLVPMNNKKRELSRRDPGSCSGTCTTCSIVLQTSDYEALAAFG